MPGPTGRHNPTRHVGCVSAASTSGSVRSNGEPPLSLAGIGHPAVLGKGVAHLCSTVPGAGENVHVLFLTPHPWEGASSRYRVLQYLPHLEARGIRCTVSPFLSPSFYRIAYQQGAWPRKCSHFLISSLRRLRDVITSGRYDVMYVHLEAFPIGPPVIEWWLTARGLPIVFDLDDAIFLPRSDTSPLVRWLRMPEKLPMILRRSRCVITCNDYLREYAEAFNTQVHMIPTCVDIEQFRVPVSRPTRARPIIGWVGSHSTAVYLELLRPVF